MLYPLSYRRSFTARTPGSGLRSPLAERMTGPMASRPTRDLKSVAAAPDLRLLNDNFARALRASNRSPRTVRSYTDAVRLLADFLDDHGMPASTAGIRREHVEAFIQGQLQRWMPATAANRFRSLQQFLLFCVKEGEIAGSPMARMKPPKVPDPSTPVLTDPEQARLLKSCSSTSFEDRRDHAIMMVFIDTGARLSEVAGLRYDPDDPTKNDVDLDVGLVRLVGKGGRERAVPIGAKAIRALDRYLRARPAWSVSHDRTLARPARPDGTKRHPADASPPCARGLHRPSDAPHVPPHVRASVAVTGRHRGRPDADRGVAQPRDAGPLRRISRGRARAGCSSPPQPRR
jgi:site-specific recombinase XerD